jgi:hypothetical protein
VISAKVSRPAGSAIDGLARRSNAGGIACWGHGCWVGTAGCWLYGWGGSWFASWADFSWLGCAGGEL